MAEQFKMYPYNGKRNTNVISYGFGPGYIIVEFADGSDKFYKYTADSCGTNEIKRLKSLALAGEGLNAELAKNGHPSYSKKGTTLESVM